MLITEVFIQILCQKKN